jgi:hypothetical protein
VSAAAAGRTPWRRSRAWSKCPPYATASHPPLASLGRRVRCSLGRELMLRLARSRRLGQSRQPDPRGRRESIDVRHLPQPRRFGPRAESRRRRRHRFRPRMPSVAGISAAS